MTSNININFQESDNYYCIIKGDNLFDSGDVTFYIKNFKIPSMTINPATVDVNQNVIYFPSQGRMDYDPLNLDILVDDNLNSYLGIAGWLNRLKDPEKLLQSHTPGFDPMNYKHKDNPLNSVINNSNQHPIEYRDIDIIVTDRQHQKVLKFTFVDSWVSSISGLELDAQNSEYLTANATFYFLYMKIFNAEGVQIIPQPDDYLIPR